MRVFGGFEGICGLGIQASALEGVLGLQVPEKSRVLCLLRLHWVWVVRQVTHHHSMQEALRESTAAVVHLGLQNFEVLGFAGGSRRVSCADRSQCWLNLIEPIGDIT